MPYSHAFPPPQGLYDPRHEHDACGVAFVATLRGTPGRDIVDHALTALENLGLAEVDMLALKQAGLVGQMAKVVKIIKTGELTKAVKLTGIGATAGAKAVIEAAGGSVA